MVRLHLIFFCLQLFFVHALQAQKINDNYIIHCDKAIDEITIDGMLDELSWQRADVADSFFMVLPMDTSRAAARTEVRVTYDEKNFYISAICYDDLPGSYVVESMKRDFSFGGNDNFLVFIDPFDDKTNGFSFGANAAGAQWDGLQYDGGSMNLSWDNKWYSEVKNYEDKWIWEAAIPFKTLRYKKNIMKWGINFSRLDLKLNEKSSWTPIPRQFPTASLAFTGNMIWDELPPPPGTNVSLIPYITASTEKDKEAGTPVTNDFNAGFDAKVSVTPSLNLDLTVNPDFSQVEVDRQVTNLSRFELFFPERRQFFIENSDLFANLGFRGVRPFFSRRIGLESPIYAGARLSGKINRDWRIGMMDIHTGEADARFDNEGNPVRGGIPSQNYAVAVLQRQVFARSNITASFINRETFNMDYSKHDSSFTDYNRDLGIEYNLASANNLWSGKFLFHKSFSPDLSGNELFHAANLEYDTKNFSVEWVHEYVGDNYNAEVGFIPRTGYYRFNPEFSYSVFPKSKNLVSHGPNVDVSTIFDVNNRLTDNVIEMLYEFSFLNRSSFGIGFINNYIWLFDSFDPTNSGGEELPAGSDYNWWNYGFGFNSTPKRRLTYDFLAIYGGYYNGNNLNLEGGIGYRFQPYGSINVDFAYNDIQLPEPYTSTSFLLVSPRLELTFTNKIFLTTFVQYNEQANNANINTRFQWRFLPASDIFLVYTENYLPGDRPGTLDFTSKNRALVLKVTYWYNI